MSLNTRLLLERTQRTAGSGNGYQCWEETAGSLHCRLTRGRGTRRPRRRVGGRRPEAARGEGRRPDGGAARPLAGKELWRRGSKTDPRDLKPKQPSPGGRRGPRLHTAAARGTAGCLGGAAPAPGQRGPGPRGHRLGCDRGRQAPAWGPTHVRWLVGTDAARWGGAGVGAPQGSGVRTAHKGCALLIRLGACSWWGF